MAEIIQAGAPSKYTVGAIGDIYTDSVTGRRWECVSVYHISAYHGPETTCEWDEIDAGSGSGDGHTHSNKTVLDKLSQSDGGDLLFDGNKIQGGGSGEPGADGVDGKSAYQIAVDNGFEGDETAWLESLKGEKGETGSQGPQGERGETGPQSTIEVVDYSASTNVSFDLYPNKVYNLGTRDSVTINFLAPEDETVLSLYTVSITGGDAVVAPVFQRNGVEITIDKGTTEFVAGGKYEFSYNWADEILIAQ